jgi:hypothetical protein
VRVYTQDYIHEWGKGDYIILFFKTFLDAYLCQNQASQLLSYIVSFRPHSKRDIGIIIHFNRWESETQAK